MAENEDRTLALLGIAATKQPLDQPCPPENMMSAFIENRIDAEKRAMMLSHLNQCEDCYTTWETLSVFLADNPQETPAIQQKITKHPGLLHRLSEWFNSGFTWQTAIPGLALASLAIALVINIPHALYKSTRTDPAVVAAATLDADTLAQSIQRLPMPWKNQTFGFNSTDYSMPAKAVGAGIWSARNTLMNTDDPLPDALNTDSTINWQQSNYRDYYAFGQWMLDAWVLASAKQVKPAQWALISQSLKTLESDLKQHRQADPEASTALQAINKMKPRLSKLSRGEAPSTKNALARDIESSLQTLFL